MLQQATVLETDIARSIARLTVLAKEVSASPSIPAFYYSASLLHQYAQLNGPEQVRSDLFQAFHCLIQEFGQHDFSQINKNHQAIIDDILEIVDSELFIDCMRPDIYKSRGECMKNSYEDMVEEESEWLEARSKGKFKGSNSSIREGSANRINGRSGEGSPTKTEGSFFLNQHDQLWEMVERGYQEHNLDEAFLRATEYVEKVGKKMEVPPSRQKLINQITEEYMLMANLQDEFDKPGWVFDKEDKGITLEYKVYEEEKSIAIRIHGEFDIPAIEFLSIISEIDLMGEYVPFCYDCKEQKVISRNERIGTSKIYIPLLTDRETYFYAVGYDRMKELGNLFFFSKTINDDLVAQEKYNFKVPEVSERYVRLEYKFFIVEYTPITKNRARIRLASKIDMKMNYLPQFILNKSARIFAFDYFKNILEKVKNYKGSAWEKKVSANPQMYDFFFRKIDQYLGK